MSSVSANTGVTRPNNSVIALKLPLPLRLCHGKYQLIDHDGYLLIELSAAELIAVSQFVRPIDFATGFSEQQRLLADEAVTEARLE